MKIAILSYRFLPNLGGGEIVLAELASRLSRERNTVFVISNFAGPVGMSKNYLVYRTPHLPSEIASRVAHLLVAPFMLLYIHLVNKVDVVQSAGLMDLFAAFPVKVMFRVPVILRLSMWKHADLVKRLKTAASFMANIIIALRSDMKAELIEAGLKGNQIVVIPNGVDTNKFRPSSTDRHKMMMLWVGRLDSHKEPHLAIETLALIKGIYKNVCLQIIGQGCVEEQLRELVSRYKLHDSVRLLGYQNHDRIAEIMGNADIFLITSKGEGVSNALLEAMACGMVIVATSASSCGVIQNGVNGYIANEPEDMASIVSRLIDDEVLRRKIGKNARRTVLEKFSADRMFSAYLQLYENLTSKRMHSGRLIVMICRQVYPHSIGGVEIHTHYVVKELVKRNKVVLISEGKVPFQSQGRFTHLNIIAKSFPLLSSISFILLSLISLFSKFRRVDVLHAQGALSPAFMGVLAKIVLKAPLVITCHGSEVRLQKSMCIRALQRLAFLSADRITTVSHEIKDILVSRYQVEPSKISVVLNGYDEELLRKYLKNNKDADVSADVVYVGRLSYPKDPVTLLYAFEQAHKVSPSFSLCFVGDGGLRPLLEQFCREHGLSNAVRFLGKLPHDEAIKFMAQSTVFVLSSYEEGLPTALIEAMALEKPVIATAVGGILEVVKDGMNGILIPPKSPEHVAKAFKRLLTNSKLRTKLGKAAAESVKDYTWSKITEKYEIVYQEALRLRS